MKIPNIKLILIILIITSIVMMLFFYITMVVEWKKNGLYNNTYSIPIYSTGYNTALTIFGVLGIVLLIITAAAVIPDGNISYSKKK